MTGIITTEFTNSRTREALGRAILASSKASPIMVVDVRWGTYYPVSGEFRPVALEPWLKGLDINYAYHHELGNPFKDLQDIADMERKYKDYVLSLSEFDELVSTIRESNGTFCLLCYCKPPKPCHRYWLRDMIWSRVPEARREPTFF